MTKVRQAHYKHVLQTREAIKQFEANLPVIKNEDVTMNRALRRREEKLRRKMK